jgi:uncharacterized repeat protein (TIGR01451 family)
MKRALILILLLILPLALAEEKIHDAWHPYHDYFTIGDDYYEVVNDHRVTDDGIRIQTLIKRNQASYIISTTADLPDENSVYALAKEQCKVEGYLRFCVLNVSLEPSKQARADEAGKYHYGTKIIIYEEKADEADITITKNIASTTLYYGEETKVTVTLKNDGNIKAENINYTETIGKGLTIINHKDYQYRLSEKLKVNILALSPGESKSFQYLIKADDYLNTSNLNSTVSYESPAVKTETKTDKITITYPFKWSSTISKKETSINDPLTHTIVIENKEKKPIHVILTVSPSDDVLISKAETYTKLGDKYSYEKIIPEASSVTITLEASNKYTGTYNLSAHLEVEVNEQHIESNAYNTYTVKTKTITPKIVLSKTKMRSGEPITIGVYLTNEDASIAFYQIAGWVGSDFFNQSFTLETLPKSKEENVIFRSYTPPITENAIMSHDIELSGSFITHNGEQSNFYTKKTITVIPKNLSILITQATDKKALKRGEEVTITVDVENIADSGSNFVKARDLYDEKLERSFGSSEGETFLYPGEERELYLYKLRIPYTYTSQNFSIISELTANGQAITTTSTTITVTDPLEPGTLPPEQEPVNEPITTTPNNEQATEQNGNNTLPVNQSQPTDQPSQENNNPYGEEKPGVLKKILLGIADFFANFFS